MGAIYMISAVTVLYHKIRQHSLDRSVFISGILLIVNIIIEKIGKKLGGSALLGNGGLESRFLYRLIIPQTDRC